MFRLMANGTTLGLGNDAIGACALARRSFCDGWFRFDFTLVMVAYVEQVIQLGAGEVR